MIVLKGQIHDRTINFLKGPTGDGTKNNKKKPIPKRYGISPVSDKRKEDNKIYEAAKAEWRKEREAIDGFRCAFEKDGVRCSRRAFDSPHHKAGRIGEKLYAKELFLAVCKNHHRFIHDNPKFSYEAGFMLKRI